jgi:hypothetical protein
MSPEEAAVECQAAALRRRLESVRDKEERRGEERRGEDRSTRLPLGSGARARPKVVWRRCGS